MNGYLQPWHPKVWNACKSACIPAPPPESDPAIVHTIGGGIACADSYILMALDPFLSPVSLLYVFTRYIYIYMQVARRLVVKCKVFVSKALSSIIISVGYLGKDNLPSCNFTKGI